MRELLQQLRQHLGLARTSRSPATPGQLGEDAAATYLKNLGYTIIARNLRDRAGEIDLLVQSPDGNTIAIVEVKTGLRHSAGPPPELRVGKDKQRKLTALGHRLLQRHNLKGKALRFDVIGVTLHEDRDPDIRHYPAAFEAAWS